MKGSLIGFMFGIALLILALFISVALPTALSGLPTESIDLAQMFIIFLGVICVLVGALAK